VAKRLEKWAKMRKEESMGYQALKKGVGEL
jgi:hypothetical protein